jgi:transketolase
MEGSNIKNFTQIYENLTKMGEIKHKTVEKERIHFLKRKANKLRNIILDMAIKSGGHLVSSFSCVEILVVLYYDGVLKVDPRNPEWEERDRFILSKGHGEMVLYAVLADLGFFPLDWFKTRYRKGDCFLGGHPDFIIPGVEVTTGSLGHGLGIGAGISLAAKMNGKPSFQYVLMGDAECTEGSVWETALFASKHRLNNLIAIVDRNHLGVLDFTENYTALEPLSEKWSSFGWEVGIVNGHSFEELIRTFRYARTRNSNRPLLVIAETIKGKGVSFMENNPIWHVLSLSNEEDIKRAKEELLWNEGERVESPDARCIY